MDQRGRREPSLGSLVVVGVILAAVIAAIIGLAAVLVS